MVVTLDGRKMTDKAALHEYVKEQLHLPEYYGKNLDALYDVLTDREELLEIQLYYAQELKEVLCGYGEAFIETLQDAAADGRNITVRIVEEELL